MELHDSLAPMVDDDTPIGGIAFIGETLADFVSDIDDFDPSVCTVERLNEVLEECGIEGV